MFSKAILKPGSYTGHKEIGNDYEISFTIYPKAEKKGTILFTSRDAVFYLSDPENGKLGFSGDGYLDVFNYSIIPGQQTDITISGNKESTSLTVNNKLVQTLVKEKLLFNNNKDAMYLIHTLVFPLQQAGNFNSTITFLRWCRNLSKAFSTMRQVVQWIF